MLQWERCKHWGTFARAWHLFDASWQNPLDCGELIVKYLKGEHKPIYHPVSDCGDHVVIINTQKIAFPGQDWRWRAYYHDTNYPGGKTATRAWELHDRNPILVMRKAIYTNLSKNTLRRALMERCHLYPDDKIPEEYKVNITNQIRPLRLVPRTLDSYTKEEIENFPKVFDFPEKYTPR